MDYSQEADNIRKSLYSPSDNFEFQSTDGLVYDEVSLLLAETVPANPEHNAPPKYFFDIFVDNQRVGFIHLRVCYSLAYYIAGQIGYGIDEPFRGKGYAAKACRALKPLIKTHGFKKIILSTDENNMASRRSCEKIGATLIHTIDTPEWIGLYSEGQRRTSICEWAVE